MNIRQEEQLALQRRKLSKKPEELTEAEIAKMIRLVNLELKQEKEGRDAKH